jgi:hypothetical protein
MEEIVKFEGGNEVMATDKYPGQTSEARQHDEPPSISHGPPNVSGLVVLAGTIVLVTAIFF